MRLWIMLALTFVSCIQTTAPCIAGNRDPRLGCDVVQTKERCR